VRLAKINKSIIPALTVVAVLSFLIGCKKKTSLVEVGIATQTLHVGNGLEPQDLDPHLITGISEIKILSALLEGLVGQAPEDLSPVPGVAESWDISEDGRIYTFHLRPQLKWSDGTKLTTEDFIYSFQRMLNPKLGAANAYLLFSLKNAKKYYEGNSDWDNVGVAALDQRTLIIELENPTPYFLRLLAHPAWFPLPKTTLSKFGEPYGRATGWTRAGSLVANGPFQLSEWRVNERIHLTRNNNYWDNNTTRLNEIYFYPTESREAEERAYRGGRLHLTEALPTSRVQYYQDRKDPALQIDPYLGTYYLQLNSRKPPLSDSRVRRALSLVLDRRLIVEKVTQGDQQPAWHFTPPGTAGYTPDISGQKNLDEAKRLLTEAGFENGEGFPELTYLYNTSESHKAIAEAIQSMWQTELGIKIRLENQEWKVYTQSREAGSFHILKSSWIADYEDPSSFLDVWTSQSGNNFTGWKSVEYDHLIRTTRSQPSATERTFIFEQAEKLLIAEQPIIPLYFYTSVYLKHPSVAGYYPTLLNYHPWKYVYLKSPED
jgi:oligopeptide transport system substrate-binding protein